MSSIRLCLLAVPNGRYLAHGTATDYMFEVLKVPMPYTWEIYGDFAADFHDCFRMFNPLTAKHLQVRAHAYT